MLADRRRFERLSKAERFETILTPGNAVYIAPCWWQITSLDAGVSIAVRYDLRSRRGPGRVSARSNVGSLELREGLRDVIHA